VKLVAQNVGVALGTRQALVRASISVAAGELVAVVGPNGAGKSTLLRVLAGLLKPSSGTVVLGDRPLANLTLSERARAIAYLPQDRSIHWPLTVASVVALGRLPHGASLGFLGTSHRLAVEEALAAMELLALRNRPATDLSGGELARVLVARALAQDAQLFLADEPTAGLDPAHQLTLFHRLRQMAASGRGIAVALHDLSLAARFCDRIVLLCSGQTAAEGSPEAVLTPELLAKVYGITARLVRIDGLPLVVTSSELHPPPT
jgi:iron complex transport system ATP-binding protein